MPVFEYICPSGHKIEVLQSSPARFVKCDCGKVSKRILSNFSAPAFPGSHNWEKRKNNNREIQK